MWVDGLSSIEGKWSDCIMSIYLVTFDVEGREVIWGARISGQQADEVRRLTLAGSCHYHSANEFRCWLRTDLGVSLENEATRLKLRVRNNAYSILCGVFIHGRSWSIDEYCQYGYLCETKFGNLKAVSLGWMEAGIKESFGLFFCH